MKNVQAIHIPTNKPTTGILVETLKDLQEVDKNYNLNPLIFQGIKRFVNVSTPVFINRNGGYCQVKDVYRIIGREDLN